MISTYIIIVTYNATPWLEKCLGSLDFEKYKVVVVDNNSQDETVKIIEQDYPQIELFKEKENLGFGQANNRGISYALNQGAEQVFLLNQDAYLIDDCLEKLVQFQKNNQEYGILSPIHTNAEVTRLDRNFSNYVRYDMNPNFYSDFVLGKEKKPVYEVPFVNAAGWLLSKKCLMTVGGFDPIFFHYGEDDNYCQRVSYHKFKIGIIPNALMVHDRENRKQRDIKKYSKEYFDKKERSLKIKFADLNNDNLSNINQHINKFQIRIRKEKIKLNFEQVDYLKKELELLKKIKLQAFSSVKRNKNEQPNYLSIETNKN